MNARGDTAARDGDRGGVHIRAGRGLLSPVLIRLTVATLGAALRTFGVTGRLAAVHLATSGRRLPPW
jgi:hypothetical protein